MLVPLELDKILQIKYYKYQPVGNM